VLTYIRNICAAKTTNKEWGADRVWVDGSEKRLTVKSASFQNTRRVPVIYEKAQRQHNRTLVQPMREAEKWRRKVATQLETQARPERRTFPGEA
jgi:hypothetical protein